jgi:hypothetical protein
MQLILQFCNSANFGLDKNSDLDKKYGSGKKAPHLIVQTTFSEVFSILPSVYKIISKVRKMLSDNLEL